MLSIKPINIYFGNNQVASQQKSSTKNFATDASIVAGSAVAGIGGATLINNSKESELIRKVEEDVKFEREKQFALLKMKENTKTKIVEEAKSALTTTRNKRLAEEDLVNVGYDELESNKTLPKAERNSIKQEITATEEHIKQLKETEKKLIAMIKEEETKFKEEKKVVEQAIESFRTKRMSELRSSLKKHNLFKWAGISAVLGLGIVGLKKFLTRDKG